MPQQPEQTAEARRLALLFKGTLADVYAANTGTLRDNQIDHILSAMSKLDEILRIMTPEYSQK